MTQLPSTCWAVGPDPDGDADCPLSGCGLPPSTPLPCPSGGRTMGCGCCEGTGVGMPAVLAPLLPLPPLPPLLLLLLLPPVPTLPVGVELTGQGGRCPEALPLLLTAPGGEATGGCRCGPVLPPMLFTPPLLAAVP